MQIQVITYKRQKGIGKKSGQAYDFQVVGGIVTTAQGQEFAEVVLDGDIPTPEVGKRYDLQITAYPDREKKLQFRVHALAPVAAK
jgi:hypothetical protein